MASNRRSYVLRIASDPVCYLWTGVGPLETPATTLDPAGARWSGAAELISIPSLQALINGIAQRVDFVLSGVSSETLRLALADAPTVHLADVRLGYVEFDQQWQLIDNVVWEWRGKADALRTGMQAGANDRTRTITLMVGSDDAYRSNPNFTHWTDGSQRQRSPDDAFCSHVASLSLSATRRFGPK